MPNETPLSEADLFELRLFLEEVICDACRFRHASEYQIQPAEVEIRQDVRLGSNAFADILVRVPARMSYFVEVDYGYSERRIAESILRKYGKHQSLFEGVSKLVLLIDNQVKEKSIRDSVAHTIPSSWELEIWNEKELQSIFRKQFDVQVASVSPDQLLNLRDRKAIT